jgi:predicted permease
MNYKKISNYLMWSSLIAVVVAGFVFFTQNNVFNLAGTQWILIAIMLGVYSIGAKMQA